MRLWVYTCRGVLSATMVVVATAKLWSGYGPRLIISEWAYYLAAVIELGIAGAMLSGRWCGVGAWVGVGLALIGVGVAFFSGYGSCGCLGVWWELSRAGHVVFCSVVGLLGVGIVAGRHSLRCDFGRVVSESRGAQLS